MLAKRHRQPENKIFIVCPDSIATTAREIVCVENWRQRGSFWEKLSFADLLGWMSLVLATLNPPTSLFAFP